MLNKFMNSNFIGRWGFALTALFSPGSFISLAITLISLYLSIVYKSNIPFSNLMAIIGSAFGGVSGAFFKDEYDKISGKNILEKKGRSALRNLQGISTQLCNIKLWILDFSKKTRKQEDKRTLDEINRHISTIELNISSGLEDWVDIVPELKEKSLQGAEIDKKYQEAVQSMVVQLLESRKELAIAKDEKIEQELKKKISDLEKQVKEIKKERSETFTGINMGPTGFTGPSQENVFSVFNSTTCPRCGKSFTPNYLSTTPLNLTDYNYCENCKKIVGGELIN